MSKASNSKVIKNVPEDVLNVIKSMTTMYDRILVFNDPVKEEITKGGIILPNGNPQESAVAATVLQVGPGDGGKALSIRTGDRILHNKYAGTEIKYKGVDLRILRETDALCIIE